MNLKLFYGMFLIVFMVGEAMMLVPIFGYVWGVKEGFPSLLFHSLFTSGIILTIIGLYKAKRKKH